MTASSSARQDRLDRLPALMAERILVLDGAMGTLTQAQGWTEADYRGERFRDHPRDLRGDADILSLTQPDGVRAMHAAYLAAGADIVTTNTFTATSISQGDYGLDGSTVRELNASAARLAREAADAAEARRPVAPALRRRLPRTDEPHRFPVPGCQRPGRAERHVARAGAGVPGERGGPARRRRRPPPHRDDLRHAQREGGDLRGPLGAGRARRGRAAHRQRHDRRRLGTNAVRPDPGGVLALDPACAAAHRRAQLRARAEAAARACRPAGPHRRPAADRLPQRRPAERARRLRRDARTDGRRPGRMGTQRPAEHRRLVLRLHARPHPGDRGGGRGRPSAAPPRAPAHDPPRGPRAGGHPAAGRHLRERRRTDQRDRVTQVRPPHRR